MDKQPGSQTGCRVDVNGATVTRRDGTPGTVTCGPFGFRRDRGRWVAELTIRFPDRGLTGNLIIRGVIADDFADRDLSAFATEELQGFVRRENPTDDGFEFFLEPAYGLSYPRAH